MTDRTSLRDEALRLSPTTLSGEGGRSMLYTLHVVSDTLLARFLDGILARFPMFTPSDGLVKLGRDRRIIRGPEEPESPYRGRLRRFRATHRLMGNWLAVLRGLAGFLTPHAVKLRIWTDDGMVYTREADGAESWARRLGEWDWDGETHGERFWVIIYPPESLWIPGPLIGDADLWGGAIGSEGYVIGFTATSAQLSGIRDVIRQCKSLNSECAGIIVAFDPDSFAPDSPEPDGGWDRQSVPGTPYSCKRLASARYCEGVPA